MKNKPRLNKQKGSALLLTLGILSLALILGMSFAFSARTNRQVTKVSADQVKAKLLAESCLNRVLASMKYNFSLYETDNTKKEYFYPNNPSSDTNNFISSKKYIDAGSSTPKHKIAYISIGTDNSDNSDPEESKNLFDKTLFNNCNFIKDLNKFCNDNSGTGFDFNNSGFQSIVDNTHKNKNNDPIVIGRIGFVILEEGSKFDINQLLTLRQGSDNIPFVKNGEYRLNGDLKNTFNPNKDFYYPILSGFTPTTEITEGNTIRRGLIPQEIRVDTSNCDYLTKLPVGYNPPTTTSNTYAQWFSYDHLKNIFDNKFDDDFTFFKYNFFSQEEPNAFMIYDSATPYSYKIYHRFDITGYEWGDRSESFYNSNEPTSSNKGSGWKTDNPNQLVDDLVISTGTEFDENNFTKCIPFLSTMVDYDGDDVSKHVAANMIDFCDEDSNATLPTSFDKDNFATISSDLEYCGNEKVAYFNELAFLFTLKKTYNDTEHTYSYELSVQPYLEMANIYDEAVDTGTITLQVFCNAKINCDPKCTLPTHNTEKPFTFTRKFTRSSQNIDSNTTFLTIDDFTDAQDPPLSQQFLLCTECAFNEAGKETEIDSQIEYLPPKVTISVEINKILITSNNPEENENTKYFDVAFTTENFSHNIVSESTTQTEPTYYVTSIEAEDSRVNHRSKYWKWKKDSFTSVGSGGPTNWSEDVHTIGKVNSNHTPPDDPDTTNDDKGIAYDFEDFNNMKYSTAYIKNKPFNSPWELGCIHRAQPGCTINLKKFTPPDSADGKYQSGDAYILDQIKVGPLKYTQGNFNINSHNIHAFLDILLKNVNIDNKYSEIDDTETPTDLNLTENLKDTQKCNFPDIIGPYRGAIASLFENEKAAEYTTDSQAEALIGRTANLLTTRSDPYTIVIIAQAMQEYDPPITSTEWADKDFRKTLLNPTAYKIDGETKPRYCSILGTQVMLVHLVRDAWTNNFTILQKRFLEE